MTSNMTAVEIDATVRTWGNSLGIVIPLDVARQLEVKAGATVHVKLEYDLPRNDASRLPTWDFALPDNQDLKQYTSEAMYEEYQAKERRMRRQKDGSA